VNSELPNEPGRIVFVDALRGYALMGLFLIHMVEYYEVYWLHPEPGPVNTIAFAIFGGKAYAMFALLFGLSFFIILDNQARKGVDFRGRFAWRVLLLLAMGYIHGLLYGGDILIVLAVAGFIILPFWRSSSRALLGVSLVFLLQVPTVLYFTLMNASLAGGYESPFFLQINKPVFEAYAYGSLGDVISTNVLQGMHYKWAFMIESGRFSNAVGLAFLGCLLGRIGFFTDKKRFRRTYVWTLATFLLAAVVLAIFKNEFAGLMSGLAATWLNYNVVNIFLNNALAGVTVMLLLLLYQYSSGERVLGYLAPPGRMSLTVYVSQSLLCIPIFYGFGLNAHAWVGQIRSLVLGLVLWVLLVAFAQFWMKRFCYGPLEWLWRALTLSNWQIPFRRRGIT